MVTLFGDILYIWSLRKNEIKEEIKKKKNEWIYIINIADVLDVTSCSLVDLSDYLNIYLWLYSPLLDLGRFFSFLFLYIVGRTP
jgi:hypothetical protein